MLVLEDILDVDAVAELSEVFKVFGVLDVFQLVCSVDGDDAFDVLKSALFVVVLDFESLLAGHDDLEIQFLQLCSGVSFVVLSLIHI